MTMNNKFSKRFGHLPADKEISIREEASEELRGYIIQLMYELGVKPSELRTVVCRVLKKAPDIRGNWSEYPNIDYEVNELLRECDWFFIYDIIEVFCLKLPDDKRQKFHEEINDYFRRNGIGWKLESGHIEIRGDLVFEGSVSKAVETLSESHLNTAKTELHEAVKDLSRRPSPDITGAIQHSLASFECLCREISGNTNMTLGELIRKYSGIVPPPLDSAIEKIWGFSSEQGRHLKEGKEPTYEEAELVVHLISTLTNYLGKKLSKQKSASKTLW
jgi:hypothetical protein